ncbi:sensor histidine kinase [Sediminitomix flava]|uniref:histidine kinase n=1 Tax=Sediminitomix flava TaxID=379075 RepID=A0A315ZF12_SEDFL|nr:HAMP domain-containing sensor histidine kinase [Sediminitomix flava]PWJ43763.1 HAMP domain-containing protein [Sediminitomix flava]
MRMLFYPFYIKDRIKKRNHSFLISIVAFIISISLQFFFFYSSDLRNYADRVEDNLKQASSKVEYDLNHLKEQIKKDEVIRFNDLLRDNNSALYIYKNQNLVFWNNNVNPYSLPYSAIKGYYTEKCISYQKVIYFVKKSALTLFNNDFQFVAVIPLEIDPKVDVSFIEEYLNSDIFPESRNISLTIDQSAGLPIYNAHHKYMFSLEKGDSYDVYYENVWLVYFFMIIAFCYGTVSVSIHMNVLLEQRKTLLTFFLLTFFTVLMRFAFLWISFRLGSGKIDSIYSLFWGQVFYSSLQELIISVICCSVYFYFLFRNFNYFINIRGVLQLSYISKIIVSGGLVLSTFLFTYAFTQILKISFQLSDSSLDLLHGISFDYVTLQLMLLFAIFARIYFFITHTVSKLLNKLLNGFYLISSVILIVSFMFFTFHWRDGELTLILFSANAVYVLASVLFNFPQNIYRDHLKSLVYICLCAMVCALIGANANYWYVDKENIQKKESFAYSLVNRNPYEMNYLIGLKEEIEANKIIKKNFRNIEKVRNELESNSRYRKLRQYFNQYDVLYYFFDEKGVPLNSNMSLRSMLKPLIESDAVTHFNNIYYKNDLANGIRRYVMNVRVDDESGNRIGYLLMELNMVGRNNNSGLAAMNVEEKYFDSGHEYSYAVFQADNLVYSQGDFTYTKDFIKNFAFKEHSDWMRRSVTLDGYLHYRLPEQNGNMVIISSQVYSFDDFLSSFSFLFLFSLVIFISKLLAFNISTKGEQYTTNFITKIQLYLDLAFFIPMIIIGGVVLTVLSNRMNEEMKAVYKDKAKDISRSIADKMDGYVDREVTESELRTELQLLAGILGSDIYLYDTKGRFIEASHPYLLDAFMLSDYINPKAYSSIIELKQSKVLLSESIGNLNYNTAFASIRSASTGNVIGIVSMPFFRSEFRLNQTVLSVLAIISKLLTLIFLSLIPFSYLMFRSLVSPLELITQKIKKISLSEKNEPIDYHTNDEFGLLINEYNRMLVNLEQSKVALARSQKESAWREIARQVAHEIKNPLTPMRLAIQQLQRTQKEENPRVNRMYNMLLTQVDTLSDIATSFSSFAQMPIPKEEKIDITVVLKQVMALHRSKEEADIHFEIPEEKIWVIGDGKLLGRIFTNIILNGIQAVEQGTRPKIYVEMRVTEAHQVRVEVKDNGRGIEQEHQQKIFVPNFTTKEYGSGIGLAISKRGIEHLNGNIWFETEVGVGTSFFVELPLLNENLIVS